MRVPIYCLHMSMQTIEWVVGRAALSAWEQLQAWVVRHF